MKKSTKNNGEKINIFEVVIVLSGLSVYGLLGGIERHNLYGNVSYIFLLLVIIALAARVNTLLKRNKRMKRNYAKRSNQQRRKCI